MNAPLPREIFKAYDIRGIVGKTLTADIVRRIGHGLGSLAVERGQRGLAVGRDGRLSGPELATALMEGIRQAGIDTIDVGCVPTLLLNARNDPFLPEQALPPRRQAAAGVQLEFPRQGGHVGFVTGRLPGRLDWLPQRILHYFQHEV